MIAAATQVRNKVNDGMFICIVYLMFHPSMTWLARQGRPEKLRGPGQRVKVGPFTQVVR